ncbi:hypothetical protein N2152v2_008836 [Parachlorella kessleri]
MLEAACALDQLAAQRLQFSLPRSLLTKSRSYGDFSDFTDSEGTDGDYIPSSKRRAGSSENLLTLELAAAWQPSSDGQPTPRRSTSPHPHGAQPAAARSNLSQVAKVVPAPTGRNCDGACGCPGQRSHKVRRSIDLDRPARVRTAGAGEASAAAGNTLTSCPPSYADVPALPPLHPNGCLQPAAAAEPLPVLQLPLVRCGSLDAAKARSHGPSPPNGVVRPCSLFVSSNSSLLLVEPPSLIGPSSAPSPAPSLDDSSASPPSSASGASPFGTYAASAFAAAAAAALAGSASGCSADEATATSAGGSCSTSSGLQHSRSDDTCLGSLPSGSLFAGLAADLGPPRASMDSVLASHHLDEGSAAEELFYRLNHARQTLDFVKRQAAVYSPLNRAEMDVWEALGALDSLREYETALLGDDDCDPSLGLKEHALQTAEACRLAYPEEDWLHLVGLIHDLGKLLAHRQWGSEPQWAVCGETFPVGCRFHPSIIHSQFFSANPDRRRRVYSSATGMYQPGCGLNSVYMSWSAAEYLYMVLLKNKVQLPPEALFVIRYHRCAVLLRPGSPYTELLSAADRRCLPWLRRFREVARYVRQELPGRLEGEELRQYYDGLVEKYIPQGKLRW